MNDMETKDKTRGDGQGEGEQPVQAVEERGQAEGTVSQPAKGEGAAAAGEPAEQAGEDVRPSEDVVADRDPVEEAREEVRRTRDQMLRIAADFDNFRKRSRREVEDSARRAKEDLLRELLPIFDNMERAVVHAEQATDAKAVADGVKLVLKQFSDTLGKLGIKRIVTVGSAFDPVVHEAIQQIPIADQAPGTVVAEVQSGYQWDERLVRAAMVIVAKAVESSPKSEVGGDE